MRKIAIISPAISVKGGISTVIDGFVESGALSDFKFYHISSHIDGPKLFKIFVAVIGLIKISILLAIQKIDIVYLHSGDVPSPVRKYFFYKLSKIFKCKIIIHWHGASFMEQYPILSNFWKKKIKEMLSCSDLVICLSKSWKNSLLKLAPDTKLTILPNAVKAPEQISGGNKCYGSFIRITFLGHIGSRKGVWDLLQVIKKLVRRGYSVKLYLGGNGEIDKLKQKMSRLNIHDNVHFLGWISDKQRDGLLRKTDIFVLPSYGEGMPMSVLESMSYGIPVVTTKVGGIPELVKDKETGFLVDPGDTDSLYHRIELLINNGGLRSTMGEKARMEIKLNYNLESYHKKLIRIFNSI